MIEIENVHKSFGALQVLKGVSMTVRKGEVVTISRRITSTSIKQIGLIQQLLGSLGRLRADQLLQ